MNRILLPAFFLFSLTYFTGCSPEPEDEPNGIRPEEMLTFDYGKTAGTTYTNPFFSLQLTMPDTWEIQQLEKKNQLEPYEADLFSAVYVAEDESKNSGLDVTVIRKSDDQAITDGGTYLQSNHSMIDIMKGDNGTVSGITEIKLGGETFHTQTVEIMTGPKLDVKMTVEFYVRPINGYWLQITAVYTDEDRKKELYWLLERSDL